MPLVLLFGILWEIVPGLGLRRERGVESGMGVAWEGMGGGEARGGEAGGYNGMHFASLPSEVATPNAQTLKPCVTSIRKLCG